MTKRTLFLALAVFFGSAQAQSQTPMDSLKASFQTPPLSAKPRVWWHWMNGNVTKEGITADLEWMKRVGIGGMQMFDIGEVPQFTPQRLVWMTPPWKDALKHAAAEADRLGLEMTMAASGGWSETAGPWVRPQAAMKRIVFSETITDAVAKKPLVLTKPADCYILPKELRTYWPDTTFFVDTKVIAFRLPAGTVAMRDCHPTITYQDSIVSISFSKPYTAYALSSSNQLMYARLQYSEDNVHWSTLLTSINESNAFSGTSARYWRIITPYKMGKIRSFDLLPTPRVADWWDKAQYGGERSHYDGAKPEFHTTPEVAAEQRIPLNGVLDLTAHLRKDGTLDWQPAAGKWVILRMGYTLTGATNHPAAPEASGLEVDKLSYEHVTDYMKYYTGQVSDAVGPYFGKSLRFLLMDSWECNTENWTENILDEFRKRKGYDPLPYLPALAGRVVGSAEQSDRFLLDWRRTLADLVADNHYKLATQFLQQKGMGLYAEAPGIHIQTTADGLLSKGQVSVPMGEFWAGQPQPGADAMNNADLKEVASAAHIYGKGLAAAESFTGGLGWQEKPSGLKQLADWALTMGVNRFVIHTSVHQPFTDEHHKPGMTLFFFGQHYTRNNTWAEQTVAFNTYLARCSHMLQQGLYAADLAYYYGDGAPVVVPFWKGMQPEPPKGYNYDWMNTDVLLNRLSVKDGLLVLPDGMSYKVLVLPADVDRLTLPVAQKIRDLVAAGATVIAPRPVHAEGLTGYPASDDSLRSIVADVWGDIDGQFVTQHNYGKGMVYWGVTVKEVLRSKDLIPDFESTSPDLDDNIVWIHRTTPDADIYFVANQAGHPVDIQTRYRVTGKAPEIWQAEDASVSPVAYNMDEKSTVVPLHLDTYGSAFVVFSKSTTSKQLQLAAKNTTELMKITGTWDLRFPAGWGAPEKIPVDSLRSWTTFADSGIRYFSGVATYSKNITLPTGTLQPGKRVLLDLGTVHEVAEVLVNGKSVGILLKPSYQLDITDALHAGNNQLEIKVANLWHNRLVGDAQPGVTKRFTFAITSPGAQDPLMESGLIGPVKLLVQ